MKILNRLFIFFVWVSALIPVIGVQAETADVKGLITFTFDDARIGIYENGAPTLASQGIKATFYGVTDYIDDHYFKNMTWDEVKKLQTEYKWDIANHTKSHANLSLLGEDMIREEIETAHDIFLEHGITPTSFSFPFGAYNDQVIDIVSDYYSTSRRVSGVSQVFPLKQHELKPYRPKYNEPAENVIKLIDETMANGEWLILEFHEIVKSNPQKYEYLQSELGKIAKHIRKQGYTTKTIHQALSLGKDNRVKNGSFDKIENDWLAGWTRSSSDDIRMVDQGGAYPTKNTAIFFDGSSMKDVIRSNMIPVNSSKHYLLSLFIRIKNFVSGGQAMWINEYDVNNKFISGQFMGGTYGNFIGNKAYQYKATSASVHHIQIAIYTNANSDLDLVIDSVRLVPGMQIGSTSVPEEEVPLEEAPVEDPIIDIPVIDIPVIDIPFVQIFRPNIDQIKEKNIERLYKKFAIKRSKYRR